MATRFSDEEVKEKVPVLRQTFLNKYADNIATGQYDDRDIDRVNSDDGFLKGFLLHQKMRIEDAASMIDGSLKWRIEYGLNDLSDSSFPRDFHDLAALFYHNQDKDGHKILWFRICLHKKDSTRLLLQKKFIAWWIEKHYKRWPEERLVLLMDMSGAGLANMDMEIIKFVIGCFVTHFPALLAYMLIYDMPWVLNAIWKIVKQILSTEQQKYVIFVKKNEIQQYISLDQLPEHMGGTDNYQYIYLPSEDSGIELCNGDTPTSPTESSGLRKRRVTFSDSSNGVPYRSMDGDSLTEEDDSSLDRVPATNQSTAKRPKSLHITNRRSSREDTSFAGSLLTISPAEELQFELTESNKELCDTLNLTNYTQKHVAYKVKTTSPEKYRVRMSSGVIKQGVTVGVTIYLLATEQNQNTVSKDKFLVMALEVPEDSTSSQIAELWKSVSRSVIMEHRLRCAILQPKQKEGSTDVTTLHKQMTELSQKMDDLLDQAKQQESELKRLHKLVRYILAMFVFLAFAVYLCYKWNVFPVTKYSVNACLPYLSQ